MVFSSVAYHRVQWSSNRPEIATRIRDAGYSVREGRKPGSWRFETSRADYREALHLARAVAEVAGLDIRSRISVAGAIYELLPLASVQPGMSVLVEQPDGTFAPERVDVRTIEDYDGLVHDLEVAHAHTYIANGILVHNSIYRFRGADIRNILEFEQAFPDTTIVVNGVEVRARDGEALAVALMAADYQIDFYCGMGVCFACEVLNDGRTVLACAERVRPGLEVRTLHARG